MELKWEIKPDRRRIPDTTPWTKPPYFGRTIALWGLYSAFNVDCPRWTGSGNGSITPQWYRRLRCVAIVLTKYTSAFGTAAQRLSPSGLIGNLPRRTSVTCFGTVAQGHAGRHVSRENATDIPT